MARPYLKLHDYQNKAADRLYDSDRTIWVAEMGAGKTLTTLQAAWDLWRQDHINRIIIWGPKRVAQTVWEAESAKWGLLDDKQWGTLSGLPAARRKKVLDAGPDILVLNYELADWADAHGVRADEKTLVILDEVSRLKRAAGKRRKKVAKVTKDAGLIWGLTGTPKGNGPIDLWGQADAIQPGVWGGFYAWRAQFFRAVDANGFIFRVLPGCEDLIDEAFAELSFKVPVPVFSDPVMLFDDVPLPPQARKLYADFEEEMVLELGGDVIIADSAMAATMKCRQLTAGFIYDELGDALQVHEAKVDALQDLIEDSGDNILAFYQFRAEIDAVRERFGDVPVLGAGTSDKEAARIIEAWNHGDIPLLLGHPASMGHGLNLQKGGRRIVWMSVTWSLEEYQQANARLARQGQERTVYIHHLNAANTIDGAVSRALGNKKTSQDALIKLIEERS